MRGALVGFGAVFVIMVVWTVFVLARSWSQGDFDRAFPACDPCGFVGYAGRMAIISAFALGTVGVVAALAGWLVHKRLRSFGVKAR